MSDLLPNTIPDATRTETQQGEVNNGEQSTQSGGTISAADTETRNQGDAQTTEATPLLAEKYKTTEDLVKAHKSAERKITEVMGQLNAATSKLKEFEVPEDYAIEIELPDQAVADIKELAKTSNMSQSQLNKMLGALHAKQVATQQKIEAQLTAVEKNFGTDKLQKLDNYIEQTYAAMPSVAKAIKQEYRLNEDVAKQFYQIRENATRKVLPTGGYTGTQDMGAIDKEMRELANKLDPVSSARFATLATTKAKMKNLIS